MNTPPTLNDLATARDNASAAYDATCYGGTRVEIDAARMAWLAADAAYESELRAVKARQVAAIEQAVAP